jgi:hypothetical protein
MERRKTPQFNLRLDTVARRELELTAEMLGVPMAEVIRRGVARVREEHVRRHAELGAELDRLATGKRAAGGQR